MVWPSLFINLHVRHSHDQVIQTFKCQTYSQFIQLSSLQHLEERLLG